MECIHYRIRYFLAQRLGECLSHKQSGRIKWFNRQATDERHLKKECDEFLRFAFNRNR